MKNKYLIFDGHLDLSMNALEWNRDLRWTVEDIRQSEAGMTDKPDRGKGTVSFPSMREGMVGICVATQIGRYVKRGNKLPGWNSPEQAWAQTQGQLAWYRAMEEAGELIQINNTESLRKHVHVWEELVDEAQVRATRKVNTPESQLTKESPAGDNSGLTGNSRNRGNIHNGDKNHGSGNAPLGYILSLEGSDSIISFNHLERAYDDGLRAIGPAHYGPGTYAQGTDATGGLGHKGRELLREIERLGLILDATHLSDESFWETMDIFSGPVWASHNNCRIFVPHNRQFSDEQIMELVRRDAVIGVALDAWMMVPDWVRGQSDPKAMGVSLELMIRNIDHICQLAGDSLHAAIGSDLDGAFGKEQSPYDLETIADLQKIPGMLDAIGYSQEDIVNIMSHNWIRFLERNLPH
ncbi:MAG: dipeptidase [Bacteroidales bacterium]